MINYGSYKPAINRSPSERTYGGSSLLKQQYQNYSKQNNLNQQEEFDVENPITNQRNEQIKNRQDRERLFMSDPNRSSSNFWDKKYTPGGKIEPEGIDKFRQQQINTLTPQTPSLDKFKEQQQTNTLTPQTPSLDKFKEQQQTNTIVASTPRLDAFREQQKKR